MRISEYTEVSSLAGTESLVVVQSGVTKKAAVSKVGTYIGASKSLCIVPHESDDAVAVANGTIGFAVPATMNGLNLTAAIATVHDKGVTATTDVQVRRRRAGSDADMLSTKITIGDEFFAADGVIDAANDDLATGDILFIDIDAIHSGTAPNGLSVSLTFA